jgi:hypothetical protein
MYLESFCAILLLITGRFLPKSSNGPVPKVIQFCLLGYLGGNLILCSIHRMVAYAIDASANTVAEHLTAILSSVFLAAINIGISAHLLTYVLALDGTGDDFFTIQLPETFRLSIRGKQVVAGFCAFGVSLLFVSTVLARFSQTVFIQNTGATESKWTAVELMAALLSLIGCLLLAGIKLMILNVGLIKARRAAQVDDERRAERIALKD